jgi:transketolase
MISPIDNLTSISSQIRLKILRAVFEAGKGHLGGSLSIVELLVAVYFGGIFRMNQTAPDPRNRDIFLLSKGHAGIALYATLVQAGIIDELELGRLNRGFLLAEHPSHDVPGVDFVSGSLGHGLSVGAGMALSHRLDSSGQKTIVLLGDGECYEGSVWEAAQFAAHQELTSLCAIVDRNGLITHGFTEDINRFLSMKSRWQSFGWRVLEVDAHNLTEILRELTAFSNLQSGPPTVLIANSNKGQGVSFMSGKAEWHHGGLTTEQFEMALAEVSGGAGG